MNIYPAIDLKNNKCVRLSKGEDKSSIIYNEDPVAQAIFFEKKGCERLHLVDLDAAFGRRDINSKTIHDIRRAISIPIQIGGGIRSEEDAKKYFDLGIDFIIIGSFSITSPDLVKNLSNIFKNRIYISLDILSDTIMIKGWEQKTSLKSKDVFNLYNDSNIRGYILTDIENDGMLAGINLKMISLNLELTTKKLIVGGGLTSYDDLKKLKNSLFSSLEGVIAGKSIYVGNIDIKKAQEMLRQDA